jgi:hypothetical protein
MVALAGLRRSRVRIRQFLRSLKPCSTGARAVLLVRVDLYPVMMTGSSGSGSRRVTGQIADTGCLAARGTSSPKPRCAGLVLAGSLAARLSRAADASSRTVAAAGDG